MIKVIKSKNNQTKEKLITKLIVSLLLIISIINISIPAFAFNINERILAKEGEEVPTLMKYGEMYILCSFTEVYKDGNKYYAYCIEPSKDGVEVLGDYNLTISNKVTDNKIYSVLLHGYPNKTPKELGVNNAGEAFLATKQAIYTLIYNRNVNDYSGVDTEAGRRTYAAYKQIVANAKKYPYVEIKPEISIEETSEWLLTENNKSLEKELKITSNTTSGKYNIFLKNNIINAKLVINNNIKDEVNINNLNLKDVIKLRIPIESLSSAGELKVEVTSSNEKSIAYEAKPDISTAQKLAIIGVKEINNISNNIKVNYLKNETQLEIYKVDEEDESPLSYVVFNIYNSENELVYENIRTDKDGKFLIEDMMPGKYIIKEIATKAGYLLPEEEVEVDVKFNETNKVIIKNIKNMPEEPKEPEEPEEPKVPEIPKKQEIPKKTLPKTGF